VIDVTWLRYQGGLDEVRPNAVERRIEGHLAHCELSLLVNELGGLARCGRPGLNTGGKVMGPAAACSTP
jgi:hypothetical protein